MSEISEEALYRVCGSMREDGMAISNYLEQLSGLLFLKACESSGKLTFESLNRETDSLYLPDPYRWEAISGRSNLIDYEYDDEFSEPLIYDMHPSEMDNLERYEEAVAHLKEDGSLAQQAFDQFNPLFNRQSTFIDTVQQLERLNGWESFGENADLFGDAYEYLLEKYADKAEGAGEYFTPRPLTDAIVRFSEPQIDDEIIDPASGTNGFLIQSYNHLQAKTDNFAQVQRTDVESQFASREIRTETYRLGLLNYLLHDIDPSDVDAMRGDSLREEKNSSEEYDLVLANPPFGSDISFQYNRRCDSSIEMNFVMMMMDLLADDGRAGIVVPEGILFDDTKKEAREELLNQFNLNTILALPEGTFQPYSVVDTNVLFFERDSSGTDEFWFYDARSEYDNIKDEDPLKYEKHFSEFVNKKNSKEECDNYFKVDVSEVDEDGYKLHLNRYKEFKYSGNRPPAEVAGDVEDELDTIKTKIESSLGFASKSEQETDGIPSQENLPDEWSLVSLSEVANVNPTISYDEPDEYPYIPMGAVSERTQSVERFDRRDSVYSSLSRFEQGDILFARITPCFENGKIAIVPELPEDYEFGVGSSEFAVIRPSDIDLQYLHMYLTSPVVNQWGEHRLLGATGRERINITQIRNELEVPVPPIQTQREK